MRAVSVQENKLAKFGPRTAATTPSGQEAAPTGKHPQKRARRSLVGLEEKVVSAPCCRPAW